MKIGFTGTQKGMTDYQKNSLRAALLCLEAIEFHHGDCIGSDAEASEIARSLGYTIICHPPNNESKRAFVKHNLMLPAKDYLARNHDIVDNTDILYACPDGPEKLRSGTWSTIRYALKCEKKVVILLPEVLDDN